MKRITVKDLAKELNLSLGAINKALNNKPGVSEETRERVRKTADLLGYRVNRVAQSMARSTLKIGIIMPALWPEYYGLLKEGILKELEYLRDYNITGQFYSVPRLFADHEYEETLELCQFDGMNAIIMCPGTRNTFTHCIDELAVKEIPVVILGSDIPGSRRLCSVRVDASMSGRLACEFMSWVVEKNKSVAIFIGNKDYDDHKEKMDGFVAELKKSSIKLEGVFETYDEPEIALAIAKTLLRDNRDLGGIYVATGNSISICQYFLEEKINRVRIVATDINNDTQYYLEKGIMQGIIFQNPFKQGRTAVRAIYRKTVEHTPVEDHILIPPQLVLRNNSSAYVSEISSTS
jgi:LacI family transcriptional regulator